MKIDWKNIRIKDLAAIVSTQLIERDIDAVLVGGACISIYTENKYVSHDLDFVSYGSLKEISKALSEIGFKKKSSRHFVRKECPFFIEFVAPPLAIGNEPVGKTKRIKTEQGSLILLTPTDSIKDRLVAFYHWNDYQALEQAVMVSRAQKVHFREIRRWSEKEGFLEKYNIFIHEIKK
jgi:hypothetical protein